jgi:hypothetical protein
MNLPLGNLNFGLVVGFAMTLAIATVLNEFGDVMFRRGVARPFFFGKYRLHHRRFLYVYLPIGYAMLSALIRLGIVQVVWSDSWTGIVTTVVIAAGCLLLDLAVDYAQDSWGWGFIHHELIYLAVPAFAFTDFLHLAF